MNATRRLAMTQPKRLARVYQGVEKLGNIVVPGENTDSGLPRFDQTPALSACPVVFDALPDKDRDSLWFLLEVFAFLPQPMIRLILWKAEKLSGLPGPLGALFRTLRIGLKGLIFSLYYSDLTADHRIYKRIRYSY